MACVGQTVPQRTHSGRQAPLLGSWTGEKSPPMPACNQADCSAWLGQACMQRPQRRQHARTSGSGSEPGARTGMVEGHAKSTPCTRPRQVPAARDRQKVLREGRGELPALLLRSPACGAYRRAPYSQACIQERQVRHSQAMARLPDMPGASRPAGQAKAHCPHPVHVRSLTYPERDKACKKRKECPCRTQIPAPEAWPHALEDCQDKPEDKHEGSRPEGTLLNLQIEKVCGMRCLKKRRKSLDPKSKAPFPKGHEKKGIRTRGKGWRKGRKKLAADKVHDNACQGSSLKYRSAGRPASAVAGKKNKGKDKSKAHPLNDALQADLHGLSPKARRQSFARSGSPRPCARGHAWARAMCPTLRGAMLRPYHS